MKFRGNIDWDKNDESDVDDDEDTDNGDFKTADITVNREVRPWNRIENWRTSKVQ